MLLNLKCNVSLVAVILHLVLSVAHAEEVIYDGSSVVVVANRSMPGSMKVAKAYMKMRQIPDDHLIKIRAPTKENITRDEYLKTIHNPILKALISRELIDAFEGTVDGLGRNSVTIYSNKIRYLVLCYGVPSKVMAVHGERATQDEPLLKQYFSRTFPQYVKTFSEGNMAKNNASVDGELSLLLMRKIPLRGFIPNPLHRRSNREDFEEILRVTRLDGPSPEAVLAMLESSRKGEEKGLRGRAYVDEDGRKGGFEIGNKWMAGNAELFESLGFDTTHDKARATFPITTRFDAPVLYAGWYAGNCVGPFTLPRFHFPDGAIAAHLHSFSAGTIRSTTKGWVGPFVDKGVACTFGNVSEPYLRLTHNFDAFFKALAEGWNFADAAYYALPGLSWQGVAIGDPLYRPFAKNLDNQLEASGGEWTNQPYNLLRKANLVRQAGGPDKAERFISGYTIESSHPAVALWRARNHAAAGNQELAKECLYPVVNRDPATPNEWGLFAEIADTLVEFGDAESGLQVYKTLVKVKMPDDLKLAFMARGVKVAQQAGDTSLAEEWAPVPEPPKETSETSNSLSE